MATTSVTSTTTSSTNLLFSFVFCLLSFEKFSITIMLITLVVVSLSVSFLIFTIVQDNQNSEQVTQRVLDRLDRIDNTSTLEMAYIHNVQQATLQKILQMVNKTGQ